MDRTIMFTKIGRSIRGNKIISGDMTTKMRSLLRKGNK